MSARKYFVEPGQRFGRLVVLDPERRLPPTPAKPSGRPAALVRCDCGTELLTWVRRLHDGHTRSCGCLRREQLAEWNQSPAGREHRARLQEEWSQSPENREQLARCARSPENRRRAGQWMTEWHQSPAGQEHKARLPELSHSPEANERRSRWARSPENREQLARWTRWARSPENLERLRALRATWAGSLNEPIELSDPEWCQRHNLSFHDHSRRQQEQRCYREWAARVWL